MAILIGHTDRNTNLTFGRLIAAIQARNVSEVLRTSVAPEQQAFCAAIAAREDELTNQDYYDIACDAAAKLLIDTWEDYPRPGTEKPYKPGLLIGNQNRLRLCNNLFQYVDAILKKIDYTNDISQIRFWNYTTIFLYKKLCW